MTKVFVKSVGLCAPGLDGWEVAEATLAGKAPYEKTDVVLKPLTMLPANERRRSVYSVRLALQVATEAVKNAGADAGRLQTVFASSLGDTDVMNKLCLTLKDSERAVSPTIFHNSVHNAPAGYWGIGTGAMSASTSVAGGDNSFAVGLTEAVAQVSITGEDTLFVAYDMVVPYPLSGGENFSDPFAVALILSFSPDEGNTAIRLSFDKQKEKTTTCRNDSIENLRLCNPAARSLPLLETLAAGDNRIVTIDYAEERSLALEITCH